MKNKTKILIVYCLWFGFVLWLSMWFAALTGWLVSKLLPAKILDQVGFIVMLVLWSGFICLFAWLPIWWIKKRRWEIVQTGRIILYIILLLGCTTLCTITWDNFVAGEIYNCADSVPFDFLRPGDWVHSHDGISAAIVPKINPSDPMDKPDTIKVGWNIPKLWLLWWSFVFASVAISTSLTLLIFRQRKVKVAEIISP